jgi:serine/threonine protein phosphatase PrpC
MQATCFHEVDMTTPTEIGRLGRRSIALFSTRSPGKDTSNEDSAALLPWDDYSAVLVVADGLGGQSLGEVASRKAVQALERSLALADRETFQLRTAIIDGIEAANQAVLAIGAGAATTLAIVELSVGGPDGDVARTYHVGDAGVLVCGGRGRLKLLTTAHAPVAYGVEAGLIGDDEAMHHADRHVVSNVVGATDSRIELGASLTLSRNDTVLIASDGLFDNLTTDELIQLSRRGTALDAARRLADAARERMASTLPGVPSKPDDLTLLVVR